MGENVVQGLRVDVDRLAQARQRLAPRLGEQAEVQGRELFEVPDILEQAAIRGALLVDEGHRRGGRAHAGHGDTSFGRPYPAHGVPQMTDEG